MNNLKSQQFSNNCYHAGLQPKDCHKDNFHLNMAVYILHSNYWQVYHIDSCNCPQALFGEANWKYTEYDKMKGTRESIS